MQRNRMEAFSDGVFAIAITILVLELKVPHEVGWPALAGLKNVFLSYVMSFLFIGLYWNNHHHLVHTVDRVTGRILWANLHMLFWISLIPFVTAWMGENDFANVPTALYGVVMLFSGTAYKLLQTAIIREHGETHKLAVAIGKDFKLLASLGTYAAAIPASLVAPWLGFALYGVVAMIWFIPDRRIASQFRQPKV